MTEKQQEAIAMLNEIFCTQSKEFQFQYKRNYFALLEFIMDNPEAAIMPYSIGYDGSLMPNKPESYRTASMPDYLVPVSEQHEGETMREQISEALDKCGGDRKKAAQLLGISDRTLYRRMNQYGLC